MDRYKENLTTTPFGVTLNAFDGLGTLNNFDAPICYNNDNAPIFKSNLTRIQEILDNLDLDLDIYIASDIKSDFIGTEQDFEDYFTFFFGYSEMKGDFGLYNAKEMLEVILKNWNVRIYQSYNRWYIVEASNIFDYHVKDQIYNEVQSTGVVPTGIRDRITNQLNNTKKEFLDFKTYDKDATNLGTKRLPVLYDNNNELKAINNDLAREYLQPVSEVVTDGEYFKTKTSFYNSGFEYGSYDWNIEGIRSVNPPFPVITPYSEIATDEIAFRGRRSMKLTDDAPTTGQSVCFDFTTDTFNPQKVQYDDFTFKIKYYVKTTSTTQITSTFQFAITTSDADGLKSWNADEKTFQSGTTYVNEITVSSANVFVNYSITLSNDGLTIGSSTSR